MLLARMSPDMGIKFAAAQFLFEKFQTRPAGGLTEKEEFILRLKREVERVSIAEEDGEKEPITLEAEVRGTASWPGE
jgi:hypothetical protein